MHTACRLSILAAAFTLSWALVAVAPFAATAKPFRGGEYTVEPKYMHTIHIRFVTSRDVRWVRASKIANYQLQKCRLNGRRITFWMNFLLPRRMRLTRDGRFSRLDDWPHLTGRFSADGSKISVRIWLYAAATRWHGGVLRCPAHELRFQALIDLPAGEYAGTTAQGHPISFTLGGPERTQVRNLAFRVTIPCDPAGSMTQTYSGLSSTVDSSSDPPGFDLSIDSQPFAGGSRTGSVNAEWSAATVRGKVSAEWWPPEPSGEEEPSTLSCNTPEDGVPFTAKLVRRAPGT